MVRGLQLPLGLPMHVLIGENDEGIAAVSCYEELDGPELVQLRFMAVAWRLRHKGGGYADEMFRETLDAITARALEQGAPVVEISGRVWPENAPSQAMCRRNGLLHYETYPTGVQKWANTLLL